MKRLKIKNKNAHVSAEKNKKQNKTNFADIFLAVYMFSPKEKKKKKKRKKVESDF